MKLALKLIPRSVQERAQPLVRRAEAFVRDFEWTWTRAVVAALVLWFLAFTFIAVIPSWWLLFAENTLGWRKTKFWLFKLRDLVAVILFSVPLGAFIMIPYHVQRWRRRLRSESESRPTGGYR
jgi:hypothetical protein